MSGTLIDTTALREKSEAWTLEQDVQVRPLFLLEPLLVRLAFEASRHQ